MTSDLAQTKAVRRKALREAFPHPLNQIALWHVDSVAAIDDAQRSILSKAIQKSDLRYACTFLEALNKDVNHLRNEDDLAALIPTAPVKEVDVIIDIVNTAEVNPADIDTPVSLLLKCYLDIPMTSADVLARLELDQVDQDLASRKNWNCVLEQVFELLINRLSGSAFFPDLRVASPILPVMK